MPFPPSITPVGRWRADVGVTLSGSNVVSVADQSGNGYTLTASGTVPWSATGFNNLPAFVFNGSASWLATSASVAMSSGGAATAAFFIVGQMGSATSNFGGALVVGVGSGSDYFGAHCSAAIGRQSTSNFMASRSDDFFAFEIDTAISPDTNYRLGIVYNGLSTTAQQYVNNVAGSSAAQNPTNDFANSSTIVVGNRFTSGSPGGNPWTGPIAEAVVINTALTTQQLQDLDDYFVSQWISPPTAVFTGVGRTIFKLRPRGWSW